MSSEKPIPTSLFEKIEESVPLETAEAFVKFFSVSPLEKNIKKIGRDAALARAHWQSIPDGKEHAKRIWKALTLMKRLRRAGHMDECLLQGILATQYWMELRADTSFAKAVREKEKKMKDFVVRKKPDKQILIAKLRKFQTQKEVAKELDVDTRTIRRWLDDSPNLKKYASWTK